MENVRKFKFCVLALFFVTNTLSANDPKEKESDNPRLEFNSTQKSGVIGSSKEVDLDNPADNFFNIQLDQEIELGKKVWLVYDLKGASHFNEIPKSINDRISTGGYFLKKNNSWITQKEPIDARWLKKGKNVVHFNIPEELKHEYQVRNLKLVVEESSHQEGQVVLTHEEGVYYQNNIYVRGFVNTSKEISDIRIGDQKIEFNGNEFESIFETAISGNLNTVVKVSFRDGTSSIAKLTFKRNKKVDFKNSKIEISKQKIEWFDHTRFTELKLGNTSLIVEKGEMKSKKRLSITSLRGMDVPALDVGMINVTEKNSGYRFLPHGEHFRKGAKIEIKVDQNKLPSGYTLKDVKIFYFDIKTLHWKALETEKIAYKKGAIIARTTHFTDMITGVVKAPESPETQGFAPTVMTGIKAANPTSGIQMITPPKANSFGSASIGYNIVLPPGRNGIQPGLNVTYSSDSGNGWLGLGWGLSTSSIRVDTRWGVPRYNNKLETETYNLNGNMLAGIDGVETFLAHRNLDIKRKKDRQFVKRKEGDFSKIIRKGTNPRNYYWIVTDKSGTKFYYGGLTKLDDSAVLRDLEKGYIAEWKLLRVEDLQGNYMTYSYDKKIANVFPNNTSIKGQHVYLSKIEYTSHKKQAALYTVEFILDTKKRVDRSNGANYGFFTLMEDRLKKIEVKYKGENIRSYQFDYEEGGVDNFYKTRLMRINQLRPNGEVFNFHEFDYYEDAKYGKFEANSTVWDTGDRIDAGLINLLLSDEISALGGGTSSSHGFSTYMGAGVIVIADPKTITAKGTNGGTVGFSFGFNSSKSRGIVALIDIDGDGLKDQVISDGGMYYRKNLSTTKSRELYGAKRTESGERNDNYNRTFSERISIPSINHFSKNKSTTMTFGQKAKIPLGGDTVVTVGVDTQKTKSKTTVYFTDVNGDGLIDIVDRGTVFFNHINDEGVPTFTKSSLDTPSAIEGGGEVDSSDTEVDPQEQQEEIKNSPIIDMIRVWEAPFTGTVSVRSRAELKAATAEEGEFDEEEYKRADGVYLSIQHQGNVKYASVLAKASFVIANVSLIDVTQGDKIYFRVQSGREDLSTGLFDQVHWDPEITYTNFSDGDTLNPNGLKNYSYKSSESHIVESSLPIMVPQKSDEKGAVVLKGLFTKPKTTDDLKVKISYLDSTNEWQQIWCKKYSHTEEIKEELLAAFELPALASITRKVPVGVDQEGNPSQETKTIKLPARPHQLKVEFISDSNIDWKAISWDASLNHYKEGDYVVAQKEECKPKELDPNNYWMLLDPQDESSIINNSDNTINLKDKVSPKGRLVSFGESSGNTVEVYTESGVNFISIENTEYTKLIDYTPLPTDFTKEEYNSKQMSDESPVFVYAGKFSKDQFRIEYEFHKNKDGISVSLMKNRHNGTQIYLSQVAEWEQRTINEPQWGDLVEDKQKVLFLYSRKLGMRLYTSKEKYSQLLAPLRHDNYGTQVPYFKLIKTRSFDLAGAAIIKNSRFHGAGEYQAEGIEKAIVDYIDYTGIFNTEELLDQCCNSEVTLNSSIKPDYTSANILKDYGIYADQYSQGQKQLGKGNSVSFIPVLQISDGHVKDGEVVFTIKSENELIHKKTYKIIGGVLVDATSITINQESGKGYWLAFSIKDEGLVRTSSGEKATIVSSKSIVSNQLIDLDTALYVSRANETFGPMYRHWGQFGYNPKAARGNYTSSIDISSLEGIRNENSESDPRLVIFHQLLPNEKNNRWEGANPLEVYAEETVSKSGRLGDQDVLLVNQLASLTVSGPYGAFGIDKIEESSSLSVLVGVSIVTGNKAKGESSSIIEFIDLNGDRYPDILTKNQVQYTNPKGGFSGDKGVSYRDASERRTRKNASVSLSLSGGVNHANSSKSANSQQKAKNNTSPLSGSLSASRNSNHAVFSWTDFNGDGLLDKVKCEGFEDAITELIGFISINGKRCNPGNFSIQYNLGYSFTDPVPFSQLDAISSAVSGSVNAGLGVNIGGGSITAGFGLSQNYNRTKYALMDVNGDGLVDQVRLDVNGIFTSGDNDLMVKLNMGDRFSSEFKWHSLPEINRSTSTSESLNVTGTLAPEIPIVPPTPSILALKLALSLSSNIGSSENSVKSQLIDIDGDGYLDYVESNTANKMFVRRSKIARTNKLKRVTNPLGGTFTIDYAKSPASYNHPGGKWVMSSLMVEDQSDYGNQDGVDKMMNTYTYDQGVYERHEREFLGFGKVRSHQLNFTEEEQRQLITNTREELKAKIYRTAETEYLTARTTNYYDAGLIQAERMYNKDNEQEKYKEKTYSYHATKLNNALLYSREVLLEMPKLNAFETIVSYRPLKYSAINSFEGAEELYRSEESHYEAYDAFGNVGRFKWSNTGNLGSSGSGQYNYQTSIEYEEPNEDSYVRGLPISTKVITAQGEVRKTEADYDTDKGLIKEIRNYLTADQIALSEFDYNEYGQLILKTLPTNTKGERSQYRYDYDKYNLYIKRIKDQFAYQSIVGDELLEDTGNDYDYRFGIPLFKEDINGQKIRYEVDELGRMLSVSGPKEIAKGIKTISFEYHPFASKNQADDAESYTHQAYALTKHYDIQHPSAPITTSTFVDRIGRAVQVKKDAIIADFTATDSDGVVTGIESYIRKKKGHSASPWIKVDALGRTVASYQATFEQSQDDAEALSTVSLQLGELEGEAVAKTDYDVLDRVKSSYVYDSHSQGIEGTYAITRMNYSIADDAFGNKTYKTEVKDPLGNKKESFTKGGGLLTSVKEYHEEGFITTKYEYDGINQLTKVIDSKSNEINSGYDHFGRRTQIDHPDAGRTTLTYDLVNLVSKQSPNLKEGNKTIDYLYEYNRLMGINYPENLLNNVRYYYGNAKLIDKSGIGRLILQTDASGAKEYHYGAQGDLIKEIRTMVIPGDQTVSFTTQWAYDSFNRLQNMVYPDKEEVRYFYDPAGNLEKILACQGDCTSDLSDGTPGSFGYRYVLDMGYNVYGQRTYLKYGNGTQTVYDYENDRRRLKKLRVWSQKDTALQFMNNSYSYDPVSNVKQVLNAPVGGLNRKIGGSQMTHSYTYDKLYRLTNATGAYIGSLAEEDKDVSYQAAYRLDMSYDDLHNIRSKQQINGRSAAGDYSTGVETGYNLSYNYGKPHQISTLGELGFRAAESNGTLGNLATSIAEQDSAKESASQYSYDANGNLIRTSKQLKLGASKADNQSVRQLLWDEENRLKSINTDGDLSFYTYDAAGERAIKQNVEGGEAVMVNAEFSGANFGQINYQVYVGPHLVISNGKKYSKHIYMGSQKIVSKLGDNTTLNGTDPSRDTQAGTTTDYTVGILSSSFYLDLLNLHKENLAGIYESYDLDKNSKNTIPDFILCPSGNCVKGSGKNTESKKGSGINPETDIYYYHADHLGSSSFITSATGEVVQHVEYVPFGEVFIEERNGSYSTPYLFNGKELDEETGLYYYGARYYDPKVSNWLSVDPLAISTPEKNMLAYTYVRNNPIRFTDPTGLSEDDIIIRNNDKEEIARIKTPGDHRYVDVDTNISLDDPIVINPTVDAPDADVIGLNIGYSGIVGGGLEGAMSIAYFLNGEDEGGLFLYESVGGGIGVDSSIGLDFFAGKFNERANSKKKTAKGYAGEYSSYSIGVSLLGSYTKSWGNEKNVGGELSPGAKSIVTWMTKGITPRTQGGKFFTPKLRIGAKYSSGTSKLIKKLLQLNGEN